MRKNIVPTDFNLNFIVPKLTKEQKIIRKALGFIEMSLHESNKSIRDVRLNYAMGLLEALIMTDDKEEADENK